MTDRTASRSDARKRRAGEIVRDLIADLPPIPDSTLKPGDRVAVHCDGTTRTLTVPLPHQENPMTAKTRHDELKALLSKISEESVTTSNVLADMLDLLRERLPEPEGVNAVEGEPAEVTEEPPIGTYLVDRDGDVWERREDGWVDWAPESRTWGYVFEFEEVRTRYAPLRFATPADLARVGIEDEPAPADDLPGEPSDRCPHDIYDRGDGTVSECSLPSGHAPTVHDSGDGVMWTDGEHWKDEESNLNDLPGEPVEPGDLRAGDKVAFTWWGVEHSTCTLVSVAGGSILRADANDAGDRGIPYVVIRGGWAGGISDVRLIERAPREDEDPDEALARVIARHLDISWNGTNEAGRSDLCTAARAAREHIEAEQEEVVATLREEVAIQTARAEQAEVWMSKWQQSCNDARDERDALRERLDALRDDIVNGRLLSAAEAAFGGWLIARDDERAAKGGSDARPHRPRRRDHLRRGVRPARLQPRRRGRPQSALVSRRL